MCEHSHEFFTNATGDIDMLLRFLLHLTCVVLVMFYIYQFEIMFTI